jgi:hypothetical protein
MLFLLACDLSPAEIEKICDTDAEMNGAFIGNKQIIANKWLPVQLAQGRTRAEC